MDGFAAGAHNSPKMFGVAEFCEQCDRCATGCPAQAISYGPRGGAEWHNRPNVVGISKWTTNGTTTSSSGEI